MRAGRLREHVTLLEKTKSTQADGQRTYAWASTTTISPAKQWANVRQMRGNERVTAMSLQSEAQYVVTFRYIAALTSHYRIQREDGTTVLEITDVTRGERNVDTVCYCKMAQ